MSDKSQTAEPKADPNADMPHEIRSRNGKKGPGKLLCVIVNKADAEKVQSDLQSNVADGISIFIRPQPETIVLTHSDWKSARAEQVKIEQKRAAAISKLSDEEKALLNLS